MNGDEKGIKYLQKKKRCMARHRGVHDSRRREGFKRQEANSRILWDVKNSVRVL